MRSGVRAARSAGPTRADQVVSTRRRCLPSVMPRRGKPGPICQKRTQMKQIGRSVHTAKSLLNVRCFLQMISDLVVFCNRCPKCGGFLQFTQLLYMLTIGNATTPHNPFLLQGPCNRLLAILLTMLQQSGPLFRLMTSDSSYEIESICSAGLYDQNIWRVLSFACLRHMFES